MNAKRSKPPNSNPLLRELTPDALSNPCDPESLGFKTTSDLPDLQDVIGQPRAFRALELGAEVYSIGYNIFVLGIPDSGRTTLTQEYLERKAERESTPDDWVYVNSFDDARQPQALSLPAGRAVELRKDMQILVEECQQSIPRAFSSDEYKRERDQLLNSEKEALEKDFAELEEQARKLNFVIVKTPYSLFLGPAINGKLITPEEFEKLNDEQREKLKKIQETLSKRLEVTMQKAREFERKSAEEVRNLDHRVLTFIIHPLIEKIRQKYAAIEPVLAWLEKVEKDMVTKGSRFRSEEDAKPSPDSKEWASHYDVNVLVNNTNLHGAPVLIENQPTYHNLLGRIEYELVMGVSFTDFTKIRAGALHRANGGYLILPARDVLNNPYAWEGLKRVLRDREIRIMDLGSQMGLISTATLEPQPIPLNVKVILVGTPILYYLLRAYDEDFAKLFKVRAEFATEMERTKESEHEYSLFVRSVVADNNLSPFDHQAVARIIEHGSRIVEDRAKLSTRFGIITDLICEADYWAKKDGQSIVGKNAVEKAISERIYRSNRIEEKIQEMIRQGTLIVDVSGKLVGQINALSVISLGDYDFGRPNRVTAAVSAGGGGVIDIERQAKLAGPIHTKGVLIISGFIGARYGKDSPISLTASLTFEQSYDEVEGDSASAAELIALLSAISGIAIDQEKAITGSVNQYGRIQTIGGVNEKIEGFFAICNQKGLSGNQGVVIPEANVRSLMLNEEVINAVREGKFHIWPVQTVDDAIHILTGVPAGKQRKDGTYPAGSVNHAVLKQLKKFHSAVENKNGRKNNRQKLAEED